MGFVLQQGGGVELTGAEANVGLHVGELRGQQVPDQLHRHVLTSHLLTHTQSPGKKKMMQNYILLYLV